MMTKVVAALTVSFVVLSVTSKNPMKMCMIMMAASCSTLLLMGMKMGLSWFPLIILMLFTGGILMMFMIVSSVNPNKKMNKIELLNVTIMILIMGMATKNEMMNEELSNQSSEMKWFFNMKETLIAIVTMIMIYFSTFISLLNKSNGSLRTMVCQKETNFVSL